MVVQELNDATFKPDLKSPCVCGKGKGMRESTETETKVRLSLRLSVSPSLCLSVSLCLSLSLSVSLCGCGCDCGCGCGCGCDCGCGCLCESVVVPVPHPHLCSCCALFRFFSLRQGHTPYCQNFMRACESLNKTSRIQALTDQTRRRVAHLAEYEANKRIRAVQRRQIMEDLEARDLTFAPQVRVCVCVCVCFVAVVYVAVGGAVHVSRVVSSRRVADQPELHKNLGTHGPRKGARSPDRPHRRTADEGRQQHGVAPQDWYVYVFVHACVGGVGR